MSVPYFVTYCIDYRYDAMAAEYLQSVALYYLGTNAGAGLALGYEKYCEKQCHHHCDPNNKDMETLKRSFFTNLKIALTLQPITTIYLLNHQDCGAIRAYLACSGYPNVGEINNEKEICINAKLLTYAEKTVLKKYHDKTVILGLLDVNGSVANYNLADHSWTVVFVGTGTNPNGLWFGKNINDIVRLNC